jgi:hypothetical protein
VLCVWYCLCNVLYPVLLQHIHQFALQFAQ